MKQPSFLVRISGRLLLLGVVPAMLVIAAIVAWSAVDGYRSVQHAEEQVLAADAGGAASELSVRNDRWNNVATIVALSQTDGLFGRRLESLNFVRSVNALSDLNLSVYPAYEPDADGQDAAALKAGEVPREAMDSTGRFLPVWYDEYQSGVRTGADGLEPSVGMETLDYYLIPKSEFGRTGKPTATITEPYVKEGGLIVSHVYPIVVQKKFMGVAGVNRSLDVLTSSAGAIKKRSEADVFILSPGGQFIAATTDTAAKDSGPGALRMRRVSETPYAAVGTRWLAVTAGGDVDIFEDRDPVLGTDCLYAVEKTAFGG